MKVFLAGHNGMVGSAIHKKLIYGDNLEILTCERNNLDLLNQGNVLDYLKFHKPDVVIIAAAKVGGIFANQKYPADFIYENIQIQNNLIYGCHLVDIQKIIFLGSSCIYPKYSNQPIKESELLSGYLEPSNEPYAIAKIAGIKLCENLNKQYNRDYRTLMPSNLYGPNDNFHPENSHVLPGLMHRFHKAKKRDHNKVVVWGTGNPSREFLHVEDMASATLFLLGLEEEFYKANISSNSSHINVGSGKEISIKDLSFLIRDIVGFKGDIVFDKTYSDGTPRKLLDISMLKSLGWEAKINLKNGIKNTYDWYINNLESLKIN